MKADARYIFRQMAAVTRYELITHEGADIPEFPDYGKKGAIKDKSYIVFRDNKNNKPGHRQFTHAISFGNNAMITGLNLPPETGGKAWGDYDSAAILIEKAPDTITMLFFIGMKESAQAIFQKWLVGEIVETPVIFPLPEPMEGEKIPVHY
jgi:hypothetical protein